MKFKNTDNIKRLAIFFFYDKDGVVDDYIPYLLKDLLKNVSELLIVCNGKLDVEGRAKLKELTPHIFVRENTGFDVWAYKTGMEYYGWEKLSEYDEVVLLNFTIMGPVYPFKIMFDEMSVRDLDFWGITKHSGIEYDPYQKCKYGYIPMHIQTGFMVFRSALVQSVEFRHYWEAMPMINDYAEAVCWHEAIFTEDFTQKGFSCDTYVDTDDLKEYSNYPLMLYPMELIANRKCPIFKRKAFFNHYEELLDVSCGQAAYELYQYLAEKTDYDLNYIWDTILRTANMSDIKERMQLNYILPTQARLPNTKKLPRVALFMHIYFMDLVEQTKHYADSMPLTADIYITTNTEAKKAILDEAFKDFNGRKVEVIVIENRGRDVSSLLIGLRAFANQYDYICFAHDKKATQVKPFMVGESFSYQCFENVLSNRIFVENVITTFEDNPRLGLLVPPPPIHGIYSITIGSEWFVNFNNTKKMAEKYQIKADISANKPPIAPLGTIFWLRPQALKILLEAGLKYEDFPKEPTGEIDGTIMHAIERLYPFAAQQEGYYTGWVLTDIFSKMELTNVYRMLTDFNKSFVQKFGLNSRYHYINSLSNYEALTIKSLLKLLVRALLMKLFGEQRFNKLKDGIRNSTNKLHRSLLAVRKSRR